MQRVLGSCLIITATTCGGLLYAAELKNYLEKLLYIRHVLYLIQGEMEYTNAPLSEVFGKISMRVKEPYRTWLKVMEHEVESRREQGFVKIWNRSIDKYLADLHLKSVHSIQLKELGTFLGQLDRESFRHTMQMYLNRMELEIEKVREGMASKRRISSWLGVMGGIFLVVILI